tara:strand:+ start:2041 stop:2352 length:312 start_codon:yes stop_codon:yes gene_type:complete
METVINILSFTSIIIGSIIILIGSFGIIRLPDVYSRIHALGMIDTAGFGFLIFGMIIYSGWSLVSVKLLIMGLILLITGPISSHAVANASKQSSIKPSMKNQK